jgi:hypothetical protein
MKCVYACTLYSVLARLANCVDCDRGTTVSAHLCMLGSVRRAPATTKP